MPSAYLERWPCRCCVARLQPGQFTALACNLILVESYLRFIHSGGDLTLPAMLPDSLCNETIRIN
jgi:hypothetical protein